MGASIILHLAKKFSTLQPFHGRVSVLLDVDEHSGRFGGVKRFLEETNKKPDHVLIAYPDNNQVNIGARGFLRVEVVARGEAAHSGGIRTRGINAVSDLSQLISLLDLSELPEETHDQFKFGPALTITKISGGESFSQVPDSAFCEIDIRLTPSFDHEEALNWLQGKIVECSRSDRVKTDFKVNAIDYWPPYLVDSHDAFLASLSKNAKKEFKCEIPQKVCGPSNIGNFLAAHGISTSTGLGVSYENLHAANESACIADIAPVYNTYLFSALEMLAIKL